ncbi:uncharacterized protein LOC143144749 [Ptiloglossa arizonensis]|uniref:uncharacterized protein LOC143144749 n=1 Tax=Ptiloglossa arizonensis TaxID=3350558 RepID=UPI003FA0397C
MTSNGVYTEELLTGDQKAAYNQIVKWLEEKQVILFDALSGTGKTFILSALATSRDYDVTKSVQFIVFRRDQASEMLQKNIDAFTYVSYIMRNFCLPYKNALQFNQMFSQKKCKNSIDILYKLITYLKKFSDVSNNIKIIIVDTYTISSPLLLFLLYLVSVKNNIKLIFSGNILQQGTISDSSFHMRNNFYIIKILCDQTVNKLTRNMRSSDDNFNNKLSCFRVMITTYRPEGNIPFYFNFRYLLYCLFRSKYFTEERFDTLYLAHCHHEITKRLYRFIDHLKDINKSYVIEPFYTSEKEAIHLYPINKKFFPGLLLVIGCEYVHVTKDGINEIVCLEGMNYKNNKLQSLNVRFVNDKCSIQKEITRSYLNYYQILPAYRKWILSEGTEKKTLWQFPLRIYTLTYDTASGRTISNDVELSSNFAYVNSFYVGLSCVTQGSAIHKIHDDKYFLSLRMTEYMENEQGDKEFYYRCPSHVKNCDNILQYPFKVDKPIDKITWYTVESIQDFEKKESIHYLRIKRSMYEQSKKVKDKTTSLMKVAEFVKYNKSVIFDTIQMIPNTYSSEATKNTKLDEDYTKSKAYTFLKETFTNWISNNKQTKK